MTKKYMVVFVSESLDGDRTETWRFFETYKGARKFQKSLERRFGTSSKTGRLISNELFWTVDSTEHPTAYVIQ